MKVRIRKRPIHAEKVARNFAALSRLSQKRRIKELKKGKTVRQTKEITDPVTNTKVTVKLNSAGNLRGMSNAMNPPDSEHMRKIRAMRRFYNKQMPVLQCNGCTFASTCPKFQAGYECAFLPFLNSHKVDTPQDLIHYMKELCGVNMRRAHLMTLMETLTGASPGLETSEALAMAFEQLSRLHETMTEMGAEVTVETNDGGIIGKLFGGINNLVETTKQSKENPIELPPPIVQQIEDKSTPELLPPVITPERVNQELISDYSRKELEHTTGIKLRKRSNPQVSVSELK